MSNNRIAINQHYVPQFLLKHFTFGKKDHIWCFDKHTGKKFQSAVRNVAAERGFYNFGGNVAEGSLEPYMGRIEDLAAPIVKKIVTQSSIQELSDEERLHLSAFLAAQFLRTNAYRVMIEDALSQLEQRLASVGISKEQTNLAGMGDHGEAAKHISLKSLLEVKKYIGYFYGRDWHLQKAPKNGSLYIGDNPVVLHNSSPPKGMWGNLGLALRGVQIYISLSDKLVLSMWCPSILDKFREEDEANKVMPPLAKIILQEKLAFKKKMLEDLTISKLVQMSNDNVIHHNHLQVAFAERYIYSSKDDFDLVEDILKNQPELRHGMRMKVG